jgi:hypothetical protein
MMLVMPELAEVCCAGTCSWQSVHESIPPRGLNGEVCFVSSSVHNMRRHDVGFEQLVAPLEHLLRLVLLFVSVCQLLVPFLEVVLLGMHSFCNVSALA